MDLHLPQNPVSDRVSVTEPLAANERRSYAQLEGPGCVQHFWVVSTPQDCAPMVYFGNRCGAGGERCSKNMNRLCSLPR